MTEFYPQIKSLHIICVSLSGAIFALRGLAMLAQSKFANHRIIKMTSYVNDSILLIAGVCLVLITQQYPGATTWLSVKLSLLVLYIVLGVFALRRGRRYSSRAAFFFAAVAVYLLMFSIARSHHPLGLFHSL